MHRLLLVTATSLGLACGSTAPSGPTTPGKPNGGASGESVDITKAALPYKILRGRGGSEIDEATFFAELASAGAVCVGESHKDPHHHWAQLHLFDALSSRNDSGGRTTALGMEMFQRPFQGILDDFRAARIDEKEMLSRTGYADRWGYDWGFYSPTVALAIARKAALLALNTERELTKRVSRNGLAKLTDVERQKLPELNLDDPIHRAWWQNIMGGMEHPSEEGGAAEDPHAEDPHAPFEEPEAEAKEALPDTRSEWIYAAQVLWDETMADGAATWLGGGEGRQIVVLAGAGHCHDSAIVGRIKRRGVANAVSVRPVVDTGDGELASLLVTPENDYLFVMTIE